MVFLTTDADRLSWAEKPDAGRPPWTRKPDTGSNVIENTLTEKRFIYIFMDGGFIRTKSRMLVLIIHMIRTEPVL